MKKKTKKLLTPVILLVLLALFVAGYFILSARNEKEAEEKDETESTPTVEVLDKSKATMTKLSIGDDNLFFSYVNDGWVWDKDEKFPVDGEKLDEMEKALGSLYAYTKVEDAGELSEYGLDKPKITVAAQYSDGTEYTFSFGNVNDFNGYQYFTLSSDTAVYMLDQSVAELFSTDINSLYEKEVCALVDDSVQATGVTSILIDAGDKSNEITDEDGIKELYTPVYAMNLSNWEDYYATEEDMAALYGISENSTKVTVNYKVTETVTDSEGETSTVKVPKSYTVLLGNFFRTDEKDDDGNPVNGYFYTKEGSTVVYSVTEEKVKTVLEFLDYTPEDEDAEEYEDTTSATAD